MAREVRIHLGPVDFQVAATAGTVTWTVDEPLEKGGGDSGPSPTESVLGALGSCMAITAKIYARHKGWDLREVYMDLRIEGNEPGGKPVVHHRLILEGDLTAEQRERIAKVAGKCPVSRLLQGEVTLEGH